MDTITAENPRAIPGNNMPPVEPSPFDLAKKAVEDIYDETVLWLDGKPIDSQELADGVANLLTKISDADKQAEAARVAEKKPLDVKIAEIQSRYAPLISDTKTIKGKTVLAADACKKALEPWLALKAKEIADAAKLAREQAEAARLVAETAIRSTNTANLAEREVAEALVKDAAKANTIANKAERQTAKAGGSFGRATSLRTVWVATLTNFRDAAAHYYLTAKDEMTVFVQGLADKEVAAGKRAIPGFEIKDEKVL